MSDKFLPVMAYAEDDVNVEWTGQVRVVITMQLDGVRQG